MSIAYPYTKGARVGMMPRLHARQAPRAGCPPSSVGIGPDLPRIVAPVAGAATVPAAYWLGRDLHSRAAGLLAAVLVGGAAYHSLISSHVGWSHCLTPLFAPLALTALARALRRGEGT